MKTAIVGDRHKMAEANQGVFAYAFARYKENLVDDMKAFLTIWVRCVRMGARCQCVCVTNPYMRTPSASRQHNQFRLLSHAPACSVHRRVQFRVLRGAVEHAWQRANGGSPAA